MVKVILCDDGYPVSGLDVLKLARHQLQAFGTRLKREGYEMPKLTSPNMILQNAVIDAIALSRQLKAECSTVENASKSSPAPASIPQPKPAKRHYPIVIGLNMIQSFVYNSFDLRGDVVGAIERFFSREHLEQPTIKLFWSKAQ